MEEKNAGIGWGIASFVMSIFSIILIRFIIISIILAVLALVFGGLSKKNSFGKVGIIIGTISIVITFVLYIILGVLDVSSLFMIPSWYK